MSTCGKCIKSIQTEDLRNIIDCTGKCQRSFHIHCTDIKTRGDINTKRQSWKCEACCVSESDNLNDIADMKKLLLKIDVKLDQVIGRLDVMEKNIKCLQDDQVVLNQQVAKNNDSIKVLSTELSDSLLKVSRLESRVKDLEQRSRNCNIEVVGVPYTRNENVAAIVCDLGVVLGIPNPNHDVIVCHRVPTRNSKDSPNIVCQLRDRNRCAIWISKSKDFYRNNGRNIVSTDVNSSFPQKKLFINEHLTPENKQLLKATKDFSKQNKYQYCWVRDCKIFVKKDGNSAIVRISSISDLKKLTKV